MLLPTLWLFYCLLLCLTRAEHLPWLSTDTNPDCPQCRQFRQNGANFSSILLINGKLVIGAKNAIYYLDFSQETANYFPDKTSPPPGYDTCTNEYGQNQEDCQNYYKVILKLRNNDLYICGTEAFKPSCCVRSLDDLSYSTYYQDLSGICPASPYSPTSYIKLSDMQNVGFASTSVGVGGKDHAIHRIDLNYGSFGVSSTTKSDDFWLKTPEFTYTFEDGEYVYILFKEIATEEYPERVFSRVARICKTDEGSQSLFFKGIFITYVKARLYCPYSRDGSAPYTFDAISGAYFLDGVLYVLFTGSNNDIVETGSVLCSYTIDDIEKAFASDYKNFKEGRWINTDNETPFTCSNPRSDYDVQMDGLLMTQSVKSENVLLYSELELKTVVASPIRMSRGDGEEDFITIHAGSSNGKLLKLGVSTDDYGEIRKTKTRVSETGVGEITFLVNDDATPGAVYAMSQNSVLYVPLDDDCSIYSSCQTCQDAYPGCGWCYDATREVGQCVSSVSCNVTENRFFGPFSQCPALPQFRQKPTSKVIDLGQNTEFRCTAVNQENTKQRWEKVQGHLPYGIEIDNAGTLFLRDASAADIGCYSCTLSGVSGSVTAEACLSVRIRPNFTDLPPENTVSVSAGDDVVIPCRATGNPAPKFTWYKINDSLPEGFTIVPEGDIKLIRVINQDGGTYRCTASNNVAVISQDITLKVIGADPESGKINGGESYDVTIIIAVVGVLMVVIIIAISVRCVYKRNNTKKGSQYSSVPEGEQAVGGRYPISIQRVAGIPGSSLPTHLHTELYNHPGNWPPHSSTIAIPSRQPNGSPGFPTNLLDYVEQPPPPYQPHLIASQLLAGAPADQQEHEYDEINIMMSQQQQQQFPHHHHPDLLTVNGYNSTFHGHMGRATPPGRHTPPQIPERSSYDVMQRRESPSHRLTATASPLTNISSPQSHVSTSPWGAQSDI